VTSPAARRGRILLLTPRWPWPANGGDRLRLLRLAEALSTRYDISLLSGCQTRMELDAPVPADAPFTVVHRIHLPRWRSWWRMLLAAFTSGQPLQVAYYQDARLSATVSRLLPGHDLLACHLARMAPYAQSVQLPCWVELTDAVSLTMRRAAELAAGKGDPRRWLFHLEAARMRAWEQSLADRVDLLSLVSPIDRQHLFGETGSRRARIAVAPNGVNLPEGTVRPAGERPASVVLLGRMDALANRDALWFFVRDVWPTVRAVVPQATLQVVGHVADRDRRHLAAVPGVLVHGVVPQLASVLLDARVGVCPVRFGAGIQNKLLDYFAHGCAAVTSPIGLEGLDARAGNDVRVAVGREEWIAEVVRLLQDDVAASHTGQAGRAVAERHGWRQALQPLVDEIDALVQKARA
jgi:hypothetical protein